MRLMTKISAEKGGELSIFTELPRRAILGDSEGQRGRRREGRSLKRERAGPSPSKEGKMGGVWPIFLSIFRPTQCQAVANST